jgi:glutamate-1-semialdehyde 2,1-aminomutase
VCRFNDLDSVAAAFQENPDDIACVIVEPVAGNMGVVPPASGFLEGLRRMCTDKGALLILDEVMTGFRVARGGAQERFRITPDLTTMGKVIGGGLPVGAYGGRADLMRRISPEGDVYQAGTLSGNPLAMAAGLATLAQLDAAAYARLESLGARLEEQAQVLVGKYPDDLSFQRVGSMATLFFKGGGVGSWDDAEKCNTERFGKYFLAMLDEGIYLPPSQFEAYFISLSHSDGIIDRTGAAMKRSVEKVIAG